MCYFGWTIKHFFRSCLHASSNARFDLWFWLGRLLAKSPWYGLVNVFRRCSAVVLEVNAGLKSVWIEELGSRRAVHFSVVYRHFVIDPLGNYRALHVQIWLEYFLNKLSFVFHWKQLLLR